jgi:ammonium transporter, Amt family
MLTWMLIDSIQSGNRAPRPTGATIGLVVGLVGVTPSAGYVQPGIAILLGVLPVLAVKFVQGLAARRRWEIILGDELEVFTCHGVAGIVGSLLTGLVASVSLHACDSFGEPGCWALHPSWA